MAASLSRLFLLGTFVLAACTALSAAAGRGTFLPPPVPLAATPTNPTVPTPGTLERPATPGAGLTPLSPELSLSLLASWDAPAANHLAWFPDGKHLAISSSRGVYIYTADTLQEVRFLDMAGPVARFAISSDAHTLAAASALGGLQLWDLRAGVRLIGIDSAEALQSMSGITSLAFSPDDRQLAVGVGGGVMLWDTTETIRRPSSFVLRPSSAFPSTHEL